MSGECEKCGECTLDCMCHKPKKIQTAKVKFKPGATPVFNAPKKSASFPKKVSSVPTSFPKSAGFPTSSDKDDPLLTKNIKFPDEAIAKEMFLPREEDDPVNNPTHYKGNKFECIDIIEDFALGFNLGNSIKYILRADKKGRREEDLKKAMWYLQRELENQKNPRVV